MLILVNLLLAYSFEVNDDSCNGSDLFNENSLTLEYYPPDHSEYSLPVLYGTFNQQTYVSYVVGSWSADGSNWSDFPSQINLTYPVEMQVMFAPWIKLTSQPDSESGDYQGRVQLYGTVSPDDNVSQLWCTTFTIPYVPAN